MPNNGGSNPARVGMNGLIKLFNADTTSSIQWYFKNGDVVPQKIKNGPANVRIDANLLVMGDLTLYGAFNHVSDRNLKENIEFLKHHPDYDRILNLEPVKYNFIDDKSKKAHYGLLAQDVEDFFPHLVNETYDAAKQTNIKTVNYIELIPIMLNKMKQMQNEINILKSGKVSVDKFNYEIADYNKSTLRLINNVKVEMETVKKLIKLSKMSKMIH